MGGQGVPPGQVQGTYPPLAKVPTHQPGQDGEGEGYPKVPTPWPRNLPPSQVRRGGGVSQGIYPLAKVPTTWPGQGEEYPKVPTPTQPDPDRGGGIPRYLPPSQVRTGEGIPQGTYPPTQPGQDGGKGTPRYLPAPLRPGQDGGGGTPRYL